MQAGPHSPFLCSVASSQEAGAGQQLGCAPARPVAVPSSHGTSHHEGKRRRAGKWGGVRWECSSRLYFVSVPAQLRLPSAGMGCPASSGSTIHLSSVVGEGSVTETQGC